MITYLLLVMTFGANGVSSVQTQILPNKTICNEVKTKIEKVMKDQWKSVDVSCIEIK